MKKLITIFIIISSIFSCSNFDKNLDKTTPPNITKRDEVLMIMRQDMLKDFKDTSFLGILYHRDVKKMEEDYFYEIKNKDSMLLMIPGPSWTLVGPLDMHNEEYKLVEGYRYGEENFFKNEYRDGDDLYFFRSSDLSWAYLKGRQGYVLIRNSKVAKWFTTTIN